MRGMFVRPVFRCECKHVLKLPCGYLHIDNRHYHVFQLFCRHLPIDYRCNDLRELCRRNIFSNTGRNVVVNLCELQRRPLRVKYWIN